MAVSPTAIVAGHGHQLQSHRIGLGLPEPGLEIRVAVRSGDSNLGHQPLLPPTKWCPIFASQTTQPQTAHRVLPSINPSAQTTHMDGRQVLDWGWIGGAPTSIMRENARLTTNMLVAATRSQSGPDT